MNAIPVPTTYQYIAMADGGYTFGYDSGSSNGIRRDGAISLGSEDEALDSGKRRQAIGIGRDIRRRFAIAAWAIRRHVDAVAKFTFQAQTEFEWLNNWIEAIIAEAGKAGNFEVTGRHSLGRSMRIMEAMRTIDGDIGIVFLQDGRIQFIESDRIQNPKDITDPKSRWTHGVRTTDWGEAVEYSVFKRKRYGSYEFERMVPASDFYLHGYFDRFDQVRGIGILTPGSNTFEYVYENYDLALAKAKLSQIFGVKFKTNGGIQRTPQEEEKIREERKLALKGKAAYMVNLDLGEDAEIMGDGGQPSDQFQGFNQAMIQVALKSLDIPFSMYDESFSNFYGSRSGFIQYIDSTKSKREDNERFLEHWTRWRIAHAVMSGALELPGNMTVRDIPFRWTASGIPWWKPGEEASGYFSTVNFGFDSYSGICRMLGKDFREIMEERRNDERLAEQLGITLPTMLTGKENLNVSL